jgi:hypothetical protein
LSVGWCPSKRVVVIHCARPYTAQKVSGGCVTAISGSASKFAEDTCYEVAVDRDTGVFSSWAVQATAVMAAAAMAVLAVQGGTRRLAEAGRRGF